MFLITHLVRLEYWVEAKDATEAMKVAAGSESADDIEESWHINEIDDDLLDDEEDFDDDEAPLQ